LSGYHHFKGGWASSRILPTTSLEWPTILRNKNLFKHIWILFYFIENEWIESNELSATSYLHLRSFIYLFCMNMHDASQLRGDELCTSLLVMTHKSVTYIYIYVTTNKIVFSHLHFATCTVTVHLTNSWLRASGHVKTRGESGWH
jgi:hypothetical protein